MTIHETVYFWQDALYRLNLGKCHQSRLEYSARALKQVAHCHDMAPPQTLGELCIELAQNRIREVAEDDYLSYLNFVTGQTSDDWPIRRDIQELRRVMYRKHTDPENERLYQLIDKIRNA